ncbi:MAG: ROK family protein, partial [Candidatus Enteromonas sp.]
IQAKTGERPHTKEIVERFHRGDAFIRDLVLISAEKLGEGLRLIHSVMDLERIVVSGRVSLFGEEYLARVQQSFGEGPRICYGASYEDALFYGAKKLGLSYLWNNVPKSSPAKEE